jgi:preprotein translocase subunit SecD
VTGFPAPGFALRAVSGEPCVGCDTLPYNGFDAYLKPRRLATANDIERVETATDPSFGVPIVRIIFKPESAGKMLRVTTEQKGEALAWVVDDTVISIATIAEPFGREMKLSGIDAEESKRYFALMTGAEPAQRRGTERRRSE